VLEITVSHWLFSDQFQHLTDQNPFWSANFTIHFQWDGNQLPTKCPIFKKTADQFLTLIFTTACDHLSVLFLLPKNKISMKNDL